MPYAHRSVRTLPPAFQRLARVHQVLPIRYRERTRGCCSRSDPFFCPRSSQLQSLEIRPFNSSVVRWLNAENRNRTSCPTATHHRQYDRGLPQRRTDSRSSPLQRQRQAHDHPRSHALGLPPFCRLDDRTHSTRGHVHRAGGMRCYAKRSSPTGRTRSRAFEPAWELSV